ncbi:hypothetical protein BHE74_00030274 [Ensete ventricosum]|nr:hypothetical protein BHE74_00030274 [Ensete ventricosum]
MRIEEIRNDEWFKKNYVPVSQVETEDINLDDVFAAFDDPENTSPASSPPAGRRDRGSFFSRARRRSVSPHEETNRGDMRVEGLTTNKAAHLSVMIEVS